MKIRIDLSSIFAKKFRPPVPAKSISFQVTSQKQVLGIKPQRNAEGAIGTESDV